MAQGEKPTNLVAGGKKKRKKSKADPTKAGRGKSTTDSARPKKSTPKVRSSKTLRLTTEQREALAILVARLESGERELALSGYAGTGKTTLVRFLCQKLGRRNRLALTAPTNKAAKVLADKAGRSAGTIHSLLGLRMTRDFEGGYQLERSEMPEVLPDIVVVDEASMVDSVMMEHIRDAQGESDMAVLYVGDPAQLPPVNEDTSPFTKIDGPSLEKIVRQKKDSPIVGLATFVRENIDADSIKLPGVHEYDPASDEGIIVHADASAFLEAAIERFGASAYQNDPNHCRILAWTNEQVRSFNRTVRARIQGEHAAEFVMGEWLVIDEAYRVSDEVLLPVSSEVLINDAELVSLDGYRTWRLNVGDDHELLVIAAESQAAFRGELAAKRKAALAAKGKERSALWEAFYRHRERFAAVTYPFAQTVHKAQGSTFRNAFVFLPDLRRNKRVHERHRLLYTAITRPSDLLVLCR